MVADSPHGVTGLWHRAVVEGERRAHIELGALLEEHLVMILQSYISDVGLCRTVALEFLSSRRPGDSGSLIKVAGRCLLIAGLFPAVARRRNVRTGYFFDVGVGAYHAHASYWGARGKTGYAHCSRAAAERFPDLVGTLRGMRSSPHIAEEIEALVVPELRWN
jgi:hypothetical protein